MKHLKKIDSNLIDKREKAIGARLIWKICRGKSDKKFNLYCAKACIKLQTFY